MDAPGSSTSIFVFQSNESLAGFAARCCALGEREFVLKHPDPFILTSMPDDPADSVWSVVIPVRKKIPPPGVSKRPGEVALATNRIYIGRGPECDIMLTPKSVSRRHFALEKHDGVWHAADLGSTNGSKIDGKPIPARTYVPIPSSPVRIEFGVDVTFWFVLPQDLLAFMNCFAQQVSETSQHKLPAVTGSEKTPPENNSLVASLEALAPPPPAKPPQSLSTRQQLPTIITQKPTREQIAEAETGPFPRPELMTTWGDEGTEEKAVPPAPPPSPPPLPALPSLTPIATPDPESVSQDPDPKLMAAIRVIAAVDYLIMSVTVLFDDGRLVSIYSPQSKGKVTDVVTERILRYGPLIKTITMTLSIGDGKPVEIYST